MGENMKEKEKPLMEPLEYSKAKWGVWGVWGVAQLL